MLAEEVLRPILLSRPDIQSMHDLQKVLRELSLQSKTCKMWVDIVIKPYFLMMLFTTADHEGDFALHMAAANMMLAYLFAANKYKCSRYGLFCVRSMSWLSSERLEDSFNVNIPFIIKLDCTMVYYHISSLNRRR